MSESQFLDILLQDLFCAFLWVIPRILLKVCLWVVLCVLIWVLLRVLEPSLRRLSAATRNALPPPRLPNHATDTAGPGHELRAESRDPKSRGWGDTWGGACCAHNLISACVGLHRARGACPSNGKAPGNPHRPRANERAQRLWRASPENPLSLPRGSPGPRPASEDGPSRIGLYRTSDVSFPCMAAVPAAPETHSTDGGNSGCLTPASCLPRAAQHRRSNTRDAEVDHVMIGAASSRPRP